MTKVLIPTFHRVKIKPFKQEATLEGIEIPEGLRKHQTLGKILAVGCGTPDEPMKLKVGQTVLFPEAGNQKAVENEEPVIFCSQYDVIAYLED